MAVNKRGLALGASGLGGVIGTVLAMNAGSGFFSWSRFRYSLLGSFIGLGVGSAIGEITGVPDTNTPAATPLQGLPAPLSAIADAERRQPRLSGAPATSPGGIPPENW